MIALHISGRNGHSAVRGWPHWRAVEGHPQFRRVQVGHAARVERIRTCNVLYDRVIDHRLLRSFSGVQRILDGDLRPIIAALLLMDGMNGA